MRLPDEPPVAMDARGGGFASRKLGESDWPTRTALPADLRVLILGSGLAGRLTDSRAGPAPFLGPKSPAHGPLPPPAPKLR